MNETTTCTWATHQYAVPAVADVLFEWTTGVWVDSIGEPETETVCQYHLDRIAEGAGGYRGVVVHHVESLAAA